VRVRVLGGRYVDEDVVDDGVGFAGSVGGVSVTVMVGLSGLGCCFGVHGA
jgi:hypothetical protein